jgi:hypothetical protein
MLLGGPDDDKLIGGDADDQAFGQDGNDRFIWNPGDDTDVNEGGDGTDTAEVNGGNGAETFSTTANGTRVRFDRITPAPFAIDIGTSENLVLNANGGDDSFSATGNLAALIKITADGGAGNDRLLGSNGADVLLGGDGSDLVDGNQANDVAFLGAGDDTFQWDPGDGSDTVEGQDGTDALSFNGANIGEIFEASANGGRVRFTRNVANIVIDLNDTEHLSLSALGGADQAIINDLSGTDLARLSLNLAGTPGAATGDGQPDSVIVNATNRNDIITIAGSGNSLSVTGLAARVDLSAIDGLPDSLRINALAGDDAIDARGLATSINLILDDGAGSDIITKGRNGGAGPDTSSAAPDSRASSDTPENTPNPDGVATPTSGPDANSDAPAGDPSADGAATPTNTPSADGAATPTSGPDAALGQDGE